MKLSSEADVQKFKDTVRKCKGIVYIIDPQTGTVFNLMSLFAEYLAIGNLLSDKGDDLEIFCTKGEDEQLFYDLFRNLDEPFEWKWPKS